MKASWFVTLALAAIVAVFSGCQAPIGADRVSPRAAYKQVTINALRTGKPSSDTLSVLHRYGLSELAKERPDEAVVRLHEKVVAMQDRTLFFALAELSYAAGQPVVIQFTPHLIPVNRGILSTIYLAPHKHFGSALEMNTLADQIGACYAAAYGREPFVRLLEGKALPDTKNVNGTNVIEIAWRLDLRTGRLIVMSAEDNLVKGASGQAVQCLNILCAFDETTGLI